MIKRFERFYSAFGDRGIMFILFAFSVVTHALLAINMELPAVNPDEFGTASIAAFYVGKDWSDLMSSIGYYYGYIQALFYIPLSLVFSSPYALYKAMLVMNGVLISFIPMIAYHLASKIGIPHVWQKVTIAFCCGFYITYIAHSKFIWNEAISSLLPWLLVWCVFMAWDRKNKYSRFTFSVITGFLCAVCYAAHSRLIAVVIALVLTLIIARFVFKEKILNLPSFFVTLIVSFTTEYFCRETIKNVVWHGNARLNTVDSGLQRIQGLSESGGFDRLLATLFGHLYTFFTSTVGFGAIAIAVFIIICTKRCYEWYLNRRKPHEDGTKVYEPVKHKYSLRITFFGLYGFLAVGGSLLLSVLYKFNSGQFGKIKDLIIFGRYTDCTAPMAIFLVLAFIFLYGYTIKMIIGSAAIYGYVCLGFTLTAYPYLQQTGSYRESPILGLLPWRIAEDFTADFSPISFIIMSSMTFGIFALMIVFAACTRRFKQQLAAIASCCIFVYTTVFAGVGYLPMRAEQNKQYTTPAKEVSELLYNDTLSPQIVAYGLSSRTAGLIQFLNPNTNVVRVSRKEALPETGIAIFENGSEIPFYPEQYDELGSTEEYTVLAYGQGARDYIKYKANSQ